MATKKSAPKKKASAKKAVAKKAVAKKATAPSKKMMLNARQLAKAEACLKTSGRITIGMKEIVVTRIPKSFDPPVSID